jgi:4-amino-4-deoxy-L-arabinose transferase-like glycosyltransferase
MAPTAETMTCSKSSNALLKQLKTALNGWRLAFLFFVLAYAAALLLTLLNSPLNWDEVVHLNGALYLNGGYFDRFLSRAFYPPLFDAATALSFNVFGISLFSARLVTVVFSILSLWVVFEIAYCLFDAKTALLSAVLLALMPGYFWLSRLALIEITLLFFFSLGLLFFCRWLKTKKDFYMLLGGVAIGVGILSKYQAAIAGIIILFSLLFLARGHLKSAFLRFGLLVAGGAAVVAPWIIIATRLYGNKILSNWLYALNVGNPDKAAYSIRYPSPIFYLIELVWPYGAFHPISIFIYALCLAGLGFLIWRHGRGDKFVLVWFVVVYVFFTLITNKEWRYVIALFPALAIAAAVLITHLLGKLDGWKKIQVDKAKTAKAASVLLIACVAGAAAYSIYDTYTITSYFNINIPIEPATIYAQTHQQSTASIMVLSAFDYFSADMVRFYLAKNGDTQTQVYQYPQLPVDTYTPTFNITEFVVQCKQNNVQYVFTYENGGTVPYYNTTLNLQQIYQQLYASGNFTHINSNATFGENPRRIFVLEFIG